MSIFATNTGIKRELIPAGNYIARCYSMIHIGTVKEIIYGDIKYINKVRITWELPTKLKVFNEEKGKQPMVISQDFTHSTNETSNLRIMIESWRGKGLTEGEAVNFDITKLLGVPCMLNIIHKTSLKGSVYAKISNVSALPEDINCPDQINPTFEFNYNDKFSDEAINTFPDFIKDKIISSYEYKKLKNPEAEEITEEETPPLPGEEDIPVIEDDKPPLF